MEDRLEKLKLIYEKIDESVREIVSPLLPQVVYWEQKIELYKSKLEQTPLNKAGKEPYIFYNRLLREAEQQYLNIIKVLVSALQKNAVEEDDEFDEFLKEYTK